MRLFPKTQTLTALYRLFDEFTATLDLACTRGCATCCTVNMTLTTLEAVHLLEALHPQQRGELEEALRSQADRPRFRPLVSINDMARRLALGQDLPEEHADPSWGTCPLLRDNRCPVYPSRPFACRCMVSRWPCGRHGTAQMDDFTITVSTVFQQVIEHVDAGGGFGNVVDVLRALWAQTTLPEAAIEKDSRKRHGLLANKPVSTLMVPPAHHRRILPLLERIRAILPG
jgi:Fe-S-cluster containining protein